MRSDTCQKSYGTHSTDSRFNILGCARLHGCTHTDTIYTQTHAIHMHIFISGQHPVMWFSSKCLVNLSDTRAQYQVHQFQSRFDKALYVLVSVTRHLGHGGRGGLRKRPRHAQDDYLSSDPEFGAFACTFRTRKAKSFSSFCEQKRKILFTNSTVQAMRMREVSTN